MQSYTSIQINRDQIRLCEGCARSSLSKIQNPENETELSLEIPLAAARATLIKHATRSRLEILEGDAAMRKYGYGQRY